MPGKRLIQPWSKLGEDHNFCRGLRRCVYICYMLLLLLCFAEGEEIADQPDVVLYAAVDKSALKKNQNKADLVTDDVPEKKGLYFPLSLSVILSVLFCLFVFLQYNK